MIMAEYPLTFRRRQSIQRKKVKFNRAYESNQHIPLNGNEMIYEVDASLNNSGITTGTNQLKDDLEYDMSIKQAINTDTEQFDALFARSNGSPTLSSPHPRCYSSCSPSTVPFQLFDDTSSNNHAKSHPHLTTSVSSYSTKKDNDRRQSTTSSTKMEKSNPSLSPDSAHMKRKTYSLTHAAQAFLQSSNSASEQLEPLARSCSYKRPQSIKKYRQNKKEKEREQKEHSSRKYSTYHNNIIHTVAFDCARKSVSGAPPRISATDLMASDDPNDRWSSPNSQRSGRVGSLPLDQLQLPHDGDEEIYRVRQFNTTSKGFVNRGDSFKRSFKRSGSTSRRSSFRKNDLTPSQEYLNTSNKLNDEIRTSTHSLTNTILTPSGPNLAGILDTNYVDSTNENIPSTTADDSPDDDETQLVERIETEDGRVQDIRVYQVFLLGVSGTGKCSLLRQFKTTEYRGIYDYSASVDDDPDNTVSIMLDGIESRLHIIDIDVDVMKCSVVGDAYMVVYSITDRHSFQAAVQVIKSIREKELITGQTTTKCYTPIILVGNKSDLVRKRDVTKETARRAAFRYDCKFIETSAAINDKVDDLLAGTLKQIRISEQKRLEHRRRLTVTNGALSVNDDENDKSFGSIHRKGSTINPRNSKNVFTKFLNVFRKKPASLPADVENLNVGLR